jgi:L-ascorbate metabolism protein UlaG (beta-lactamase superfamily)
MDIIWHGYSCFTIKTSQAAAVINPYKEDFGLKLPSLRGDIVLVTGNIEGFDNHTAVKGDPILIDWPGEYEVKEIAVMAKKSPENKSLFLTVVAENVKICYMENIGKELSDDILEAIGDVDILLIAVGGDGGTDAQTAHKIIEAIEPRAVVPMNYAIDGATKEIATLEPFLKEFGVTTLEPREKFTITGKSSFKEDSMDVVILKPQL